MWKSRLSIVKLCRCSFLLYKKLTFLIPAIPLIVLLDGVPFKPKYSAVVESSEMPPLPVSKIKFRVSEKESNLPCISTTPPVSCVKVNLVSSREGSTNSSCANEVFRKLNSSMTKKSFFTCTNKTAKKWKKFQKLQLLKNMVSFTPIKTVCPLMLLPYSNFTPWIWRVFISGH